MNTNNLFFLRAVLKSLLICALVMSSHAQKRYFGVNLAGADFGTGQNGEGNLPGVHGTDYIYPNQVEVDYFSDQNMNIVRLPFRWERLQRTLNGEFDNTEMGRLETFIEQTTAKGVFVILDPHNYARYHGNLIGLNSSNSSVRSSHFSDFWVRLAKKFKDNPKVIFGLMNEPSRMQTIQWRIIANEAIAAIREEGATNLILVPGNGFTGGHSWLKNFYAQEAPNSPVIGPNGYRVGSNAEEMLNIVDPMDNFAFDIHQYLDSDFSGTVDQCVSATIGSESLAEVTEWFREHNKKGFLGEFGGGRGTVCLAAIRDITTYINDRPDEWLGWSYWAAGPWWGNYFSSLEPLNINSANPIDRPQLSALVFDFEDPVPIPVPDPVLPLVTISLDSQSISFLSVIGQNYQLQTCTDLRDGWANVGSTVSGTGLLIEIDISEENSEEVKRFYRLEVSN